MEASWRACAKLFVAPEMPLACAMICGVTAVADGLEPLIDASRIRERVAELGHRLDQDYHHTTPLFVGILRGAAIFHADLIRQVDIDLKIDFIALSSYRDGSGSPGPLCLINDLESSIEGVDVVLVEDIVDTGVTVSNLIGRQGRRNPASLRVCTLLSKPSRRQVDVPLHYVGFEVPDRFVVGYGLDYCEKYRSLPYLATLDVAPRELGDAIISGQPRSGETGTGP